MTHGRNLLYLARPVNISAHHRPLSELGRDVPNKILLGQSTLRQKSILGN